MLHSAAPGHHKASVFSHPFLFLHLTFKPCFLENQTSRAVMQFSLAGTSYTHDVARELKAGQLTNGSRGGEKKGAGPVVKPAWSEIGPSLSGLITACQSYS